MQIRLDDSLHKALLDENTNIHLRMIELDFLKDYPDVVPAYNYRALVNNLLLEITGTKCDHENLVFEVVDKDQFFIWKMAHI